MVSEASEEQKQTESSRSSESASAQTADLNILSFGMKTAAAALVLFVCVLALSCWRPHWRITNLFGTVEEVEEVEELYLLEAYLQLKSFFLLLLRILPPVMSVLVALSPLETMRRIREMGSTGKLSPLPYTMMSVNGSLWLAYGILTQDITMCVPNLFSTICGVVYLLVFSRYQRSSSSSEIYVLGGVVVTTSAVVAAFLLPRPEAIDMIGQIGSLVQVLMSSSPLVVIRDVFATKSTAAMSVGFTVASFLSCSVWTLYGVLVARDLYVWAPNFVALLAVMAQVSLFFCFGLPPKPAAKQIELEDIKHVASPHALEGARDA